IIFSSFSALSQQLHYLVQMQYHGRTLLNHLKPLNNIIGWLNISLPIMLKLDRDKTLLSNIKDINQEVLHTPKNSYEYNIHYYQQKTNELIPPDWASIEFSNLGKLYNKSVSLTMFKDSPLFAKDYIHGDTFDPTQKRYRQIFVRPYIKENLLHMP